MEWPDGPDADRGDRVRAGGGIAALAGMVSLSDTSIMSNTTTDFGGIDSGSVTLTGSSVSGNTATTTNGFGGGIAPLTGRVQVNGAPAYWLTGKRHLFWYTDATGAVTTERIRLAGNTLL